MMHALCPRPMVTFLCHCPLTDIKLNCLVTEAHGTCLVMLLDCDETGSQMHDSLMISLIVAGHAIGLL